MSVRATETEHPRVDELSEFPGLPDLPEVVEVPEVIDLRDRPGRTEAVLDDPEMVDEPKMFDEPEVVEHAGEAEQSPPPDRRDRAEVPLHRLLDRAKPSLAEAAALAALVLEALGTMHEAGCAHGDLDSGSVQVGLRGKVRLAGGKPARAGKARFDPEQRRADIRAAAGIIAEIVKSAGRPARPLTDREEKIVARLEAATDARSLSRRGLLPASRGLEQVVGGAEQRRAARQGIAVLTRAVADAEPAPTTGHAATTGGGQPGIPNAAAAPARSLPPPAARPRRQISPTVWKAAAAAAVVALVLGAEIHFFGDDVKRNVDKLLGDNAGAAQTGPKGPAPIPVLAPAAAGPVTHLDLRPMQGCRPGAVCQTVVQVTVTPQDAPLEVTWGFELLDRCGPLRESRPGGVFSIPPRGDRAVQTVPVPLPEGRALALIPVTNSPVKVAGTPMPLSADDGPC